jgi:hypothetical protein
MRKFLVLSLLMGMLPMLTADDWPQFRGPNRDGVAPGPKVAPNYCGNLILSDKGAILLLPLQVISLLPWVTLQQKGQNRKAKKEAGTQPRLFLPWIAKPENSNGNLGSALVVRVIRVLVPLRRLI